MESEGLAEGKDVTTSIVFASIILVIILLAVILTINGMSTANDTINGEVIGTYEVGNESGYLNDTGYTLQVGTQGWSIVEVIATETNNTIAPGNYTLVGNVLSNITEVTC